MKIYAIRASYYDLRGDYMDYYMNFFSEINLAWDFLDKMQYKEDYNI